MTIADPRGAGGGLRQQAFSMTSAELGFTEQETGPVWGFIMETGYADEAVSFVAFADGSASIYFSSGGGIIGAGRFKAVRTAVRSLLMAAEGELSNMEHVRSPTLPQVGEVRFYLMTYTGMRSASAVEDDLGNERHKLSDLFYAVQDVITAIRLNTQQ